MSRVTGKPPTSHWRRPITRTYDYNMALGENYYKPQLDYISTRKGRGKTPPKPTTFAERLLLHPPSQRSSSATRRGEESEIGLGFSSSLRDDSSMGRYASLDDLGLDEDMTMRRRRQMMLQASQENLTGDRGVSPLLSPDIGRGRTKVTFGDKVLDAAGMKESAASRMQKLDQLMSSEEGDAIDKILADRRNRRQAGMTLQVQTADPDLFTEDPLRSPGISSRLQQARQQMDTMREEIKKDSDTSTSRFRQRLRAKREREAKEDQEAAMFGSLSALDSPAVTSSAKSFFSSGKSNAAASSASAASSSTMKITSNVSQSAQNLMSMADDDDAETAAILSKVDQIRKRAKARLAQITDDFPDLQIESSLASRRAANRMRDMEDSFDDDFSSSRLANSSASSGGSRAVTISKRTLKSSYDLD